MSCPRGQKCQRLPPAGRRDINSASAPHNLPMAKYYIFLFITEVSENLAGKIIFICMSKFSSVVSLSIVSVFIHNV